VFSMPRLFGSWCARSVARMVILLAIWRL
jgi:hypothetical protein